MLAFESEAQRKQAWEAFSQDEEWREGYEESERDGKVFNRTITSIVLRPTDYSPLS